MKYGRTAGIGCGVVLGLGLASGASAQVTPVVAGDSITAAGINAIIAAVNSVGALQGNLDLPDTTPRTGVLRVDGTRFLHSFGTSSTFLGKNAGNFFSDANPFTGNDNTGVGNNTLTVNTTGGQNTAVGNQALEANTTGEGNTAVGEDALHANIDGDRNTAVGEDALFSNTSGVHNTAVGQGALIFHTTGSNNTAVGEEALFLNSEGNRNTAIGEDALWSNTTGESNTAVGEDAGFNATTGSNNIYLGADVQGVAGESETMYLGKVGTQTKTFIAGVRGVTAGMADAVDVVIDSSGQLGTVSSSRRYKKDIQDMGRASAGLLELRPVTFRYTQAFADGATPTQYGLIAEEVAEIYPDVVVYNDAGLPETVQYRKVNAMLLNEVQRQHRQIEAQQEQIDAFLTRLGAVERRLDTN